MLKRNYVNIIIGLVFFGVFAFLFYHQAISDGVLYAGDLPSHILAVQQGTGYSLFHFTLGLLAKIFPKEIAAAVLESTMVILTWILTQKFIMKYFKVQKKMAIVISSALLFLSSIYIPVISPYFYAQILMEQGTTTLQGIVTQPWHNITYMGMRLFAVWYMYYFCEIYASYLEKITLRDWLKLGIILALSAGVKPNFCIAMCFTLFIGLVIDAFSTKWKLTYLKRIVALGTTVFPALLVLLFQAGILYGGGDGSGIAAVFMSSKFFVGGFVNTVLKLIKGLVFPTLVFAYNYKRLDKSGKYIVGLYIITLIQVIIFKETGEREAHGNFQWGLFNSGYLLFMWYIPLFIENILTLKKAVKSNLDKAYIGVGSLLLIGHMVSGIAYFLTLISGKFYLC